MDNTVEEMLKKYFCGDLVKIIQGYFNEIFVNLDELDFEKIIWQNANVNCTQILEKNIDKVNWNFLKINPTIRLISNDKKTSSEKQKVKKSRWFCI